MKTFIRRLFSRIRYDNSASTRQLRRRCNSALQLEVLEARALPAIYNWLGTVSGAWDNANNWNPNTGYPNSSADAASLGSVGAGCTNNITYDGAVSGALGRLTTAVGFTGTLTLNKSLHVDSFFCWLSGTMYINNSKSLTLDDSGDDTWAGGTITTGDSSNGALDIIAGTSLTVSSMSGVVLGVPTVIEDANSYLYVFSTVTFDTAIHVTVTTDTTVSGAGGLQFSGGTSDSPIEFGPQSATDGDYIKGNAGNISFYGYTNLTVPIRNAGATVQFAEGSHTHFTVGTTDSNSRSYYQTDGTTILGTASGTASAYVTCDYGLEMTSGYLYTYSTRTQYLTGGSGQATNVYVHGNAAVEIAKDQNSEFSTTGYGTLYINGYGIQFGGEASVTIWVSKSDSTICDKIDSATHFDFDATGNSTTLDAGVQGLGSQTSWVPFFSESGEFSGQFGNSPGFSQTVTTDQDTITKNS
jgi:hypothetical protein